MTIANEIIDSNTTESFSYQIGFIFQNCIGFDEAAGETALFFTMGDGSVIKVDAISETFSEIENMDTANNEAVVMDDENTNIETAILNYIENKSDGKRQCPECFAVRDSSVRKCECGHDNGKSIFESLKSLR